MTRSEGRPPERVVLTVCTFRRPGQLRALLPLLVDQAATITPRADIVVVDNDPAGSAAALVAAHPGITYVHESRPGIAAARNAALDAAADHDALVFLDDDEIPGPDWLARLVAAWRQWRPAAVAGPAVPTFATPVPEWVEGSGEFRRRRHRSGELVPGAATYNLLLDVAAVTRLGLRFDERFGLTGGEDTMFTHTLVARGGEIRWCDEAEVLDPVATDRLTPRWVLRRTFRAGTSWSAMELELARRGRTPVRVVLLGKAVVRSVLALPALLRATVVDDVAGRAAAVCRIVGQLGLAYGALGGRLQEYGRATAGSPTALIAHPGAELYGSDRVVLETALGLRDAGFRVVVTVPAGGPLTDLLDGHDITWRPCPAPVLRKSALRPAGAVRLLAETVRGATAGLRMLRADDVDLVVVNTVTVPLWLLIARIPRRQRTICHVHEAERSAPRVVRWALTAPLALADTVVTNSRFSRDVLAGSHPGIAARAQIVPNAVPGPPAVTPALVELDRAVRLLFVGRLSPRKGPQIAIDAVADLVARGVDAHLDLLGSVFTGYEWFATELHASVERHGLGDRVTFLGFDTDVWPHLACCDIAVVPSTVDEPFGNTAVEALLAARPAVVSATSGLLEAAEGYGAVVQVPPSDPAALAEAVVRIVDDWPTFRAAAVADAATAQDRHGPQRYRDRMAAVARATLSA